jgi:hypothetical protein
MPSIEPWLRGTDTDVPAVARAVLHALQLAEEDLRKWCGQPFGCRGECAACGSGAGCVSHTARGAQPRSSADLRRGTKFQRGADSPSANRARSRGNLPMSCLRNSPRPWRMERRGSEPWRGKSGRDAHRGNEAPAYYRRRIARPCGRPHAAARRAGRNHGKDRRSENSLAVPEVRSERLTRPSRSQAGCKAGWPARSG